MVKSSQVRQSFVAALLIAAIMGCGALVAASFDRYEPEEWVTPRAPKRVLMFNDYMNFAEPPAKLPPSAPCKPIHFGFDGNPRKFESDTLGRFRVPNGRTWHITNSSLMMERYDGGDAVAGEWTGVLGGVRGPWKGVSQSIRRGRWFSIAQSSLDNGSGIAMQGQTTVDAVLEAGDHLTFTIWLRPDTWPGNYYFTLGASGMDCPA